jgi:hypothetical protein
VAACVVLLTFWMPHTGASGMQTTASDVTLAGFAFVDSAVTGQGSRAKLPSGARVYPPGSKVTGTDGCPTNRYRTNGLLVAVIDYIGRPTSASLTVISHPTGGERLVRAPYYLDLDPGRKLQFLGPIFENGAYEVELKYDFSGPKGEGKSAAGQLTLARACPPIN